MKEILFLILVLYLNIANGFKFTIHSNKEKCLLEEYGPQTLVEGTFDTDPNRPEGGAISAGKVDIKVVNPQGKNVYESLDAKVGKFAFTTVVGGDHQFCFKLDSSRPAQRRVSLEVKVIIIKKKKKKKTLVKKVLKKKKKKKKK